jgi:hypothetical protein
MEFFLSVLSCGHHDSCCWLVRFSRGTLFAVTSQLLRALIMSNRLQYRVTQLTNGNGDSLELRLVPSCHRIFRVALTSTIYTSSTMSAILLERLLYSRAGIVGPIRSCLPSSSKVGWARYSTDSERPNFSDDQPNQVEDSPAPGPSTV